MQIGEPNKEPNQEPNQESNTTVFEQIGGEERLRKLVDRFYDLMQLESKYAILRGLHGTDLQSARDKLFWFLCGWMGGPDYYIERFGHPRLRARHLPFAIGIEERNQWLACMLQAMEETGVNPVLQERLLQSLFQTADWMRNKAD